VLLRVSPAARDHDGDFAISQLPSSEDPCVSGDNPARLVGEHRVRPAPLADRRRYLCHLLVRMRSSIAGIRDELRERPALDLVPSGSVRPRSASRSPSSSSPNPVSARSKPAELEFAEFEAEESTVPARVKRQLVVGEAVSLDLRLRPPARYHRRHVGDAELLRR